MELMNTRMFRWSNGKISGLSTRTDIILVNNCCTIYNKQLSEAKTIFINTRMCHGLIIKFIDTMLDLITHPVNIIIAGSDYTFPNCIDKREIEKGRGPFPVDKLNKLINHKFINKIFVENLDSHLPKTFPIPLGINPKECSTNIKYFEPFYKLNINKPLKITNFNRVRDGKGQWKERGVVLKLCENNWKEHYIDTNEVPNADYLKKMGTYLFTICVHGGGIDVNPKLFEALLIGVIPIIKENKPYTDIYLELDLPVVIIDKWNADTITYENLKTWKDKYYKHFENPELRSNMLTKLSLDYYANYVSCL